MITRIEALNYRCLRYVSQPLGAFHALVGPNASGKTTFLDVIAFLGSMVRLGVDGAIEERTSNFRDLVWGRSGDSLQLAIEARIPERLAEDIQKRFFSISGDTVRYEVELSYSTDTTEVAITHERLRLIHGSSACRLPIGNNDENHVDAPDLSSLFFFPLSASHEEPSLILRLPGNSTVHLSGWYGERDRDQPRFPSRISVGTNVLGLGVVPPDQSAFPIETWFRELLFGQVRAMKPDSAVMRKPSPPGRGRGLRNDGSNLPWVIEALSAESNGRFQDWLMHLRTVLPDLDGIRIVEREEDRHRYLMLRFQSGIEVPSWMVSDGTLRLLALTLPAYVPDFDGICLVEEPENGIHPRAVEAVIQSLSSVYDAQVLLATHSPIILSLLKPADILCFTKTPSGETEIVTGECHPALRDWQGGISLGVLFAGGVLG